MQTFYGSRLSNHLSETPEGFLIAHGARLARTATTKPQQYRGSELGLPTDNLVDVYRSVEEVTSPKCLASLNGKPVTDNHPSQFLTPHNVGWYSRGHVQNVRVGPELTSGERAIIGDLVITDASLIEKIKSGLRELSVGYDCEYAQNRDGAYEQRNIRANHVAVVPNGRAGTDVRILDAARRPEMLFGDATRLFHRHSPLEVKLPGLPSETQDSALQMEESEMTDHDLIPDTDTDDPNEVALAELRALRPKIERSRDRRMIDSYNRAIRLLKGLDAGAHASSVYAASDARPDNDRAYGDAMKALHRQPIKVNGSRAERPCRLPANDSQESFEDAAGRHRREMLQGKNGRRS